MQVEQKLKTRKHKNTFKKQIKYSKIFLGLIDKQLNIHCWKIWFCTPYKTHSGSNIHGFISFMIDSTHYVNFRI